MSITRAGYTKSLKPIIESSFGDYDISTRIYPQYMDVRDSMDAYEEVQLMPGLGVAKEKGEGAPQVFDTMSEGYTARADHITYTNGYHITYEAMRDLKAPAIAANFAKRLRKSMERSREMICANVLNRAFNSSYTGGDGKELCATDHPTQAADLSNELATPASLTEASLESALTGIRDMRDDRGLRIELRAQKLVIPYQLEFQAERILGSSVKERPGTANRDISAVNAMGKVPGGILVNPYLTSSTSWFLITNADDGLIYYDREDIRMLDDVDFSTLSALFSAIMRFSTTWGDPRGVFGSAI